MSAPRKPKPLPDPALTAPDLVEALTNALLFCAGSRGFYPSLEAVRLESLKGSLTIVGTDRYVLGAATVPYKGPQIQTTLSSRDARELVSLLKGRLRRQAKESGRFIGVDVKAKDGKIVVVFDGVTLTYDEVQGYFPKWKSLFEETDGQAGSFNPHYVLKFTKVVGGYNPKIRIGAKHKPTVVTIGDRFRGLIMPMRDDAAEAAEDAA